MISKTVSASLANAGEGVITYYHYSDEGLICEYDQGGTEIKIYGYKPSSTWRANPLFMKQGKIT